MCMQFNLLTYQIKDNTDILMITERQLGESFESFPIGQFFINVFSSPLRLHCNRNGGSIL